MSKLDTESIVKKNVMQGRTSKATGGQLLLKDKKEVHVQLS